MNASSVFLEVANMLASMAALFRSMSISLSIRSLYLWVLSWVSQSSVVLFVNVQPPRYLIKFRVHSLLDAPYGFLVRVLNSGSSLLQALFGLIDGQPLATTCSELLESLTSFLIDCAICMALLSSPELEGLCCEASCSLRSCWIDKSA